MTQKVVVPRTKACADVDLAIDHYVNEVGVDLASSFIDALEQTYIFISETPSAGSTRWSHELNLPELRTMRVKGFPWVVFYLEFETHVDVWRVLHAKRDIPAWMADESDG